MFSTRRAHGSGLPLPQHAPASAYTYLPPDCGALLPPRSSIGTGRPPFGRIGAVAVDALRLRTTTTITTMMISTTAPPAAAPAINATLLPPAVASGFVASAGLMPIVSPAVRPPPNCPEHRAGSSSDPSLQSLRPSHLLVAGMQSLTMVHLKDCESRHETWPESLMMSSHLVEISSELCGFGATSPVQCERVGW